MDLQTLNRPKYRAWVLGGVAAVVGIAGIAFALLGGGSTVFLVGGVGLVLIGVFTIAMVSEDTTPTSVNKAQGKASISTFLNLIASLKLEGRPVYLPATENEPHVVKERMFIPLKDGGRKPLPPVDDEEVFHTGTDGTEIGAAFDPPGRELLDLLEKDVGTDTSNVDPHQLEEALRATVSNYELLQDVNIRMDSKGNKTTSRIIMKVGDVEDLVEGEDAFRFTVFPPASLVITALVRSTGKPFEVRSFKWSKSKGELIYELVEMSSKRLPGSFQLNEEELDRMSSKNGGAKGRSRPSKKMGGG